MDYGKEYKSFINGHYLAQGIRITAGVILPAVIFSFFDLLTVGIVVSLGATCVSVTDNPGPIQHRRNGMLVCLVFIFITPILTSLAAASVYLTGILIFVFAFIFSMIGVFGNRANSIGVAVLLVMVLNIDHERQGRDIIINALYLLAGGVWYTLLSLFLYGIRPYRLAQQVLGDCILSTADYLRARAGFYKKNEDYKSVYLAIIEKQVKVHQEQNLVRELLFQSRDIIKDSTIKGRTLTMIFVDVVDLFERTMSSYQDYELLHKYFDDDDILPEIGALIIELANELDTIGLAVQSGNPSARNESLEDHINELKQHLNALRDKKRNSENVEMFISMRHILNSIEDIAGRLQTLHLYTRYDKKLASSFSSGDTTVFITQQEMSIGLFINNLNFSSNIFRHSVRISIAVVTGYIISKFFPFGHGYWILLTIIVIMKPAYSLTRKRNYQRLLGTLGGALAAVIVLYFISNNRVLFALMVFFMIGSNSFIRSKYLIGVIFTTGYVLLMFHLLYGTDFKTIVEDRVLDTVIGSVIAFLGSFLLVPAWEHEQIKNYIVTALTDNVDYFMKVAAAFTGQAVPVLEYKVSRKKAFVSLANLSDAFTRMLAEPKAKQRNSKNVYQLVVMNHMLTSHIATLAYYIKPFAEKYKSEDFEAYIQSTVASLEEAKAIIDGTTDAAADNTWQPGKLEQSTNQLMEQRRRELKQGMIETGTRKKLFEMKGIIDQFTFIMSITEDIKKMAAGV